MLTFKIFIVSHYRFTVVTVGLLSALRLVCDASKKKKIKH